MSIREWVKRRAAGTEHVTGAGAVRGHEVRAGDSWVTFVLRLVGYALTGAMFCFPLGSSKAMGMAALGAGLGAMTGGWLAMGRVHLWVWLVGFALAATGLYHLHDQVVGGMFFTEGVAPTVLMRWSQAGLYGAMAWLVGALLRLLAARHRALSVLEVALVALSFAQLVVAHRQGAINRPFDIADPIIASGGDPTVAFYAVGAVAVVVILWLMLREGSAWRALFHLIAAALLLGGVLSTARMLGVPEPDEDALGLRGKAKDQQRDKNGARRSGGRSANDQLEFRDDYSASGNQAPVAVVLLHDDYSPPTGLYYFRQGAFSQYNGRRLIRATRSDVDTDVASLFPTEPMTLVEAQDPEEQRATVESTVALLADHKQPFGLEAPVRLEPDVNPNPARFKRVYRVTSEALALDHYALFGLEAGSDAWGGAQRAHYTQAPDDPRYAKLAEEIVDMLPEVLQEDAAARAMAVSAWLSREGVYSLRSKHAGAADPTADFLFGDKTGYCVHFAHAAVYLMRTLGLPSRVGTGYVFEESARQGGSAILLAGQNAHAWPEVYLEGAGWVVVDVSPERSLDPAIPPPDPDLQRLLGELARGEEHLPREGVRPLVPMLAAARRVLQQIAWGAAWLGLAALALMYLIKLWRRGAPLWARDAALPRLAYRAELDRLAEVRLARLPGESREHFAERVGARVPAFVRLTRAHVERAFSAHPLTSASDVRRAAQDLRRELRKLVPWWRRLWGALKPWSWMSSR